MAYPQAILFFAVFALNFFLARWLTIKLIENEFIERDSFLFKKAVLFWFTPIVGALGLWFLLLTHQFIRWFKWFRHWISLSHYKPESVTLSIEEQLALRDKEILERVEAIKEQERILVKKRKPKKKIKNKY